MKTQNIGKIAGLMAATVMWIGASTSAKAAFVIDLAVPPSDAPLIGSGNGPNPGPSDPLSDSQIQAFATAVGIADIGSYLYKANNDGTEAGSLLNSYSTSPTAWATAGNFPIIISYGSGQIASPATVLIVKDGDSGSYVFDIRAWNGIDDIEIRNLFAPKDITGTSHIEFYGTAGAVPEPTTIIAGALLLLPFGASTIRILRKNRTA